VACASVLPTAGWIHRAPASQSLRELRGCVRGLRGILDRLPAALRQMARDLHAHCASVGVVHTVLLSVHARRIQGR